MATPESELFELLKQAGNTTPGTSTGDDEQAPVSADKTQLYEDPPGVETAPPSDDNQGFSSGAVEENKVVREGVLNKAFAGKANADKADQALISKNFVNAKPGKFIAHSPHLKGEEVKKASHPRAETLVSAVRRLSGRT
jgi:hypothetical protein